MVEVLEARVAYEHPNEDVVDEVLASIRADRSVGQASQIRIEDGDGRIRCPSSGPSFA